MIRRLRSLAFVLSIITLAACGTSTPTSQLTAFTLAVQDGANLNTPVAADLVFVFDTQLTAELNALTARQWMEQRRDYDLNYPNALSRLSWEVAPVAATFPATLPANANKAFAVFFFADYRTSGEHRARLETLADATMTLAREGFIPSFGPAATATP